MGVMTEVVTSASGDPRAILWRSSVKRETLRGKRWRGRGTETERLSQSLCSVYTFFQAILCCN